MGMSQISFAQNLPVKHFGREKNNLWIFFSLVFEKSKLRPSSLR